MGQKKVCAGLTCSSRLYGGGKRCWIKVSPNNVLSSRPRNWCLSISVPRKQVYNGPRYCESLLLVVVVPVGWRKGCFQVIECTRVPSATRVLKWPLMSCSQTAMSVRVVTKRLDNIGTERKGRCEKGDV